MKKGLLLLVVLLCLGQLASADVITNVDRTRGTAGDRSPIGVFDGDTDPLATEPGNLKDGNIVFSDRDYTWINTPSELKGFEYVRTFNTDKHDRNIMVNYAVTIGEPAILAIAVDDRWNEFTTSGSVQVFESQQEMVDLIVHTWAAPGLFVDTDLDLTIDEGGGRPMSVFATQAPLAAGTYNFGLNPIDKNFYIIGASPEPATLALLGLGGLVLRRRRK